VFQLEPETKVFQWNQESYSTSNRNNFFMFSTADCLAVGGGGHFALWLDEDLKYGNSSRCSTFNNEPLSGSENFEIFHVEVWHLTP